MLQCLLFYRCLVHEGDVKQDSATCFDTLSADRKGTSLSVDRGLLERVR